MTANGYLRLGDMMPTFPSGLTGWQTRSAWEELIAEVGRDGIMFTLGFRVTMDDRRAVMVANHFLQRLNRRLFGKRYIKHSSGMNGVVVLERKHRSSRSNLSPHFHFVVSGTGGSHPLPREDVFRDAVERESSRLLYPTLDGARCLVGSISGPDFVDARSIYAPQGLAKYLTKESGFSNLESDALNIGFVTVRGIQGLSV